MENLRLLIVDDEQGMRLGVQRALRCFTIPLPASDMQVAVDVEMAETGEEAIQKIEANRPDVLLLDYKLPGMSGLDILERIHIEDSEMVTIMITAYASFETAVTAIKQGAFDFLAKPFTPDELKKMLTKAAHNLLLARQVKRLAQEKQQVRFEFIRVLGHELKSPLNAVEGYINLMKNRTSGDSMDAYESMLDRSLIRLTGMRKLIADLLDLTRIESGRKKREIQEYDLIKLTQLSLDTALPDAESIRVSIHLEAPPSLIFNCDPGEIEIILNNLISNAVKYNRQNGEVHVTLKEMPDTVEISVRDTGIGMTRQEADRLFQEFVRIKNEKTRTILGSGLGLTIVKKITTLYSGDIQVISKPDQGSVFIVTLKKQTADSR